MPPSLSGAAALSDVSTSSLVVPAPPQAPILPSVWRPAVAALLLHALLVATFQGKHGWDPSALVCAGGDRAGRPPYEAISSPIGVSGEDGQFYYSLARSPWRAHEGDIDLPPYRHLRIFYPAVCWLCTGGHPRLLLYVMPAINLLAIAGLAGIGAAVASAHGRSPWWGLLVPLAVNSGLSLLHNFTDCLSNLAAFGLVAAWLMRARWPVLVACAATAAFSREQNLALLVVVLAAALWTGRPKAAAGMAAVLLAWAGWAGFLWSVYGQCPLLFGGGNFDVPCAGLAYRWSHLGHNGDDRFSRRLAIIHFLSILHLSLLLPLGVYVALKSQSRMVAIVLFAGVALALTGGAGIYVGFNSYMRVFAWVPMATWLGTIARPARWPLLALSPGALWSLVVALGYV
jgi:hypothetical protein